MKTIIEIGKQGGENIDGLIVPHPEAAVDNRLAKLIEYIRQAPLLPFETETSDGIKKTVEVRCIPLGGRRFDLVHALAAYEPLVYLKTKTAEKARMGMLSANYDSAGVQRQDALKLISLRTPQPLVPGFKPPAETMVMLSGAASAERKGVGAHDRAAAADLEHRATILGAVSLGRPDIALGHKNHKVRQSSAVVTGLTNGQLGNLYAPAQGLDTFQGYDEPIVITREQATDSDRLYIPDTFLDEPKAFGVWYEDSARIMLGAGLQVLHNRGLAGQVRAMSEAMQ